MHREVAENPDHLSVRHTTLRRPVQRALPKWSSLDLTEGAGHTFSYFPTERQRSTVWPE